MSDGWDGFGKGVEGSGVKLNNNREMSEKKVRKVVVDLNPVEMVWLHSQHLFQKIQENGCGAIKFFKSNNGVEIRLQADSDPEQLLRAREELQRVIGSNEIRLISTSLHKDNYIRISKEARKEYPRSYIIFLHYETFENCCRKLQDKFNITSITPELERLRKNNPYFCFLVAEKERIDDIEKFTKRILNSEVSCASTTFSHRQQPPVPPQYKRALSVSSLRGSFSDHNDEQYRLSVHQNPVEEQLFEMSDSILNNLPAGHLEAVRQTGLYEGSSVSIERYQGTYSSLLKKLYYANRLQLTANPFMQPVYAYNMMEKTSYRWALTLITDQKYRSLRGVAQSQWLLSYRNKIEVLLKVGKALLLLHNNLQTYCGLSPDTVLIDSSNNVVLGAVITKQILPHTNAFEFDVRNYLMLIYWLFTACTLTYQMLVFKQQKQEYFCTLSHRCRNKTISEFLKHADSLFIGDIDLSRFLTLAHELKEG